MTKKELIQYRSICAEIEEINIKLNECTVMDNTRLLTKLKYLKKQKACIEVFIDSINDSLTRRIFEYRYLTGKKIMSWQKIAFKIGGHDEQYPRRIHNKFLKLKVDENDEFFAV